MNSVIFSKFAGIRGTRASLVVLWVFAMVFSSVVKAQRDEPIQPIEVRTGLDERKVELGKMLFFDPRLSLSGWISCNSCHNLSMGGSDNLPTSIGHGWFQGPINAPTVLNSGYNLAQF